MAITNRFPWFDIKRVIAITFIYVTFNIISLFFLPQILFQSKRLNNYMFKVIDGEVQPVLPIFGKKVVNRDGSVGTYTDGVIEIPKAEGQDMTPSSAAVINPRGYT